MKQKAKEEEDRQAKLEQERKLKEAQQKAEEDRKKKEEAKKKAEQEKSKTQSPEALRGKFYVHCLLISSIKICGDFCKLNPFCTFY